MTRIIPIVFLIVAHFGIGQVKNDSIRLPDPTGPHTIGVLTFYWSDSTRLEKATIDSTDFRQFAASVFYPGIRGSAPSRTYFPELDLYRAAFRATNIPAPRGVDLLSDNFRRTSTSIYENIVLDSSGAPYPVVFISPGGDMSRHWYTAMAQEFASNGYIVVVVSHAHSGIDIFPLGGLVRKNRYYEEDVPELNALLSQRMTEDVIFVTDRILELNSPASPHILENGMDIDQMAIVGHSRGARAVNLVLESDQRFKGGIRLDETGPIVTLSRPHMTIRAPWRNEENLKELRRLHANTDAKSYEVVIEDAGHFSFSDLPHVAPKKFGAKIDALTGHVQISRIMLEFLSELFGQENDLSFVLDSRVSKPKNIMVSIYKSNE